MQLVINTYDSYLRKEKTVFWLKNNKFLKIFKV